MRGHFALTPLALYLGQPLPGGPLLNDTDNANDYDQADDRTVLGVGLPSGAALQAAGGHESRLKLVSRPGHFQWQRRRL